VSLSWWRSHSVGRRLTIAATCELALALITIGISPTDLGQTLAWLLLDLWLLQRVARGGRTAWLVLLVLSVLTVAVGLGAAALTPSTSLPPWHLVLRLLLSASEVWLLLMAPVRSWVGPRRIESVGTR